MPKTTTRAVKPRAAKKPKPEASYIVTMEMGGQQFTSAAADPVDAIMALKPEKISAKAIFTLEHAGKTASLMRRVQWARYTLNHRSVAFYLAKNLVALLKPA